MTPPRLAFESERDAQPLLARAVPIAGGTVLAAGWLGGPRSVDARHVVFIAADRRDFLVYAHGEGLRRAGIVDEVFRRCAADGINEAIRLFWRSGAPRAGSRMIRCPLAWDALLAAAHKAGPIPRDVAIEAGIAAVYLRGLR